ncbi:hypothetical protein LX76_04651 [Cereibacter changlensis]|uniref:Uncharacterized protein n=1 Tax=Cereibacter changlensis TaxID=402884 RepID=A0A2W7QD24_9RHOB|nr:hypothetical protein LX76_04651 [Cereibacter changlensis]
MREIRHARIYLTKPNRDFNDVCHLAGVDPQATRERLTKLIAEAPSPEELIDADSPRAKTFTAFGRTATFEEWSKNTGIAKNVLWNRIADPKWTPERAVTEPVRARSCFRRARSRSEMDA